MPALTFGLGISKYYKQALQITIASRVSLYTSIAVVQQHY